MRRRSLVAAVASVTASAFVGCLDNDTPDNETEETDDEGVTDEGETNGVAVVGTEFDVVERGGGTRGDGVSVSFDNDGLTVAVEGELVGNNSCYTAELESADYDADEGVLLAEIITDDGTDDDVFCADVMTEIQYRLVVSFEGGLPDRVDVSHDGAVVVEAPRD